MVVGNGGCWLEDVLLWLHWAFLVLWGNPNPLLVWREAPLWVGCMAFGPDAQGLQHLGCSLARKRLMWSRCWCCSALLPGSPQLIVQRSLSAKIPSHTKAGSILARPEGAAPAPPHPPGMVSRVGYPGKDPHVAVALVGWGFPCP